VVPVFREGKLVALRGRAFEPDDPSKWVTGSGSKTVLFNADLLQAGDRVMIVENMVDAILITQRHATLRSVDPTLPRVVAVAGTAGAGSWRESWTAHLHALGPAEIAEVLDNDLAGMPNRETYPLALARWRAKHPDPKLAPPLPNAPKIVNGLLAAGLPARVYHWPSGTPIKADPAIWF
jgi:hypothetical protein